MLWNNKRIFAKGVDTNDMHYTVMMTKQVSYEFDVTTVGALDLLSKYAKEAMPGCEG